VPLGIVPENAAGRCSQDGFAEYAVLQGNPDCTGAAAVARKIVLGGLPVTVVLGLLLPWSCRLPEGRGTAMSTLPEMCNHQ